MVDPIPYIGDLNELLDEPKQATTANSASKSLLSELLGRNQTPTSRTDSETGIWVRRKASPRGKKFFVFLRACKCAAA